VAVGDHRLTWSDRRERSALTAEFGSGSPVNRARDATARSKLSVSRVHDGFDVSLRRDIAAQAFQCDPVELALHGRRSFVLAILSVTHPGVSLPIPDDYRTYQGGTVRFLLNWLITAAALYAAVELIQGIAVVSTGTLLLAALVFGLVNSVIKPILLILTLPITVVTLGLFYLVLNGLLLYLVAALTPGFTIASFGAAFLGALVVSIVATLLHLVIKTERPKG
jgi:putative membrane protein